MRNLQKNNSQNCNLQCFSHFIQTQLLIQHELPGINDQWDLGDPAKEKSHAQQKPQESLKKSARSLNKVS